MTEKEIYLEIYQKIEYEINCTHDILNQSDLSTEEWLSVRNRINGLNTARTIVGNTALSKGVYLFDKTN